MKTADMPVAKYIFLLRFANFGAVYRKMFTRTLEWFGTA